jgi:ESX secretion-associated protein EspD/H
MQPDDYDDLAALDFIADEPDSDELAQSDVLDFSAPEDDGGEEPVGDALDTFSPPEPADTEANLDALDSQTEDSGEAQDDTADDCTVTNPPETVSVSALLDGTPERVRLSPTVTGMTEAELADEILVIAELARQKALAAQQSYWQEDGALAEAMREFGSGADAVGQFMAGGIGLTTPEQAAAAQAEVFATRYTIAS